MANVKEMYVYDDDILLYSLEITTNNPNNVLTSKSRQEATSTDP